METLQDCNRRQKNIKIEANHLAFDSRNERAITKTNLELIQHHQKMTITSMN